MCGLPACSAQVLRADPLFDHSGPRVAAAQQHVAGGAVAGAVPATGQGAPVLRLRQHRQGGRGGQHPHPPQQEHPPEAVGRDTGKWPHNESYFLIKCVFYLYFYIFFYFYFFIIFFFQLNVFFFMKCVFYFLCFSSK